MVFFGLFVELFRVPDFGWAAFLLDVPVLALLLVVFVEPLALEAVDLGEVDFLDEVFL